MSNLRKTTQFQLPEKLEKIVSESYTIFPTHSLPENEISTNYKSLYERIKKHKLILIDGYQGVFFHFVKDALQTCFENENIEVNWISTKAFYKSEHEILSLIQENLGGNDPLFGSKTQKVLGDFFRTEIIENLSLESFSGITLVYGVGAFLFAENALKIYIDLPKNELQYRARAQSATNLGTEKNISTKETYKRFYFVDWVVLNKHKQQFLRKMDIIADGQWENSIHWANAQTVRDTLDRLSTSVFRVRPWFEPGTWGGNWCLKHISGLNTQVPNYAWSFELIVPENGILLESSGYTMEISFDFLMFHSAQNVLGNAFEEYQYEFPIRFDFLDTFEGGNLSVQCHPQKSYIKDVFNENFTQEETYYILDCDENATVYLGFQENINSEKFEHELQSSFLEGKEINIEKYVQKLPAKKHDLFLIPPGTIHASGKNNLVLEISSTPYIFTFKMYDWLRPDLDGKPRPLNIERGMQNLNFERKGKYVRDYLLSKPQLLEKGKDWELWHLPTHSEHLYDVHRIEMKTEYHVNTNNRCLVMSLVEGERVTIELKNSTKQDYQYAETFVVSAAADSFKIINKGKSKLKLVMAFVK